MRHFYFPIQDTSLYEEFPNRQAGKDEILEVGKSDTGQYTLRSLLQFDISQISSSLSNGSYPSDTKFDLKLHIARANKVSRGQQILIHPLSTDWIEGGGYFYQTNREETNGATWKYASTGSNWTASGSDYLSLPTASFTTVANPPSDLVFDISEIVRGWVSGSYNNYGLAAKYPDADENDFTNKSKYMLFSRDTHTVFLPAVIAKWDDSQYSTGSLNAAPTQSVFVAPVNMHKHYKRDETVTINLRSRTRYPEKTFDTELNMYTVNSFLPTSSYYSIVDVQSQETIIPFDEYSKLSCNSEGNYFTFRTDDMWPMRYYKIMFKIVGNNYETIIDNDDIFTIKL